MQSQQAEMKAHDLHAAVVVALAREGMSAFVTTHKDAVIVTTPKEKEK